MTGVMGCANPCTGYSATKKLTWVLLEVILVIKDPKFTRSLLDKKLLLTCERLAPA